MDTYTLYLKKHTDAEAVSELLHSEGFPLLYSEEFKEGKALIHLSAEGITVEKLDAFCRAYPAIERYETGQLPEIDWEAQWEQHAKGFSEGTLTFDLKEFGSDAPLEPIKMISGPGFGDLSHPTTRIMLKLMCQIERQHYYVVDVGCGSGVLSLAAVRLQKSPVVGIDCDLGALEHAFQNSKCNGMEDDTLWLMPDQLRGDARQQPLLLLMNMISSEQKVAWEVLPEYFKSEAELLITSGVPKEQRESYLEMWKQLGWVGRMELEEEGWLGFVFQKE